MIAVRRPPFIAAAARLVEQASRDVRVLATLTPVDAHLERARLARELAQGRVANPRWRYAPRAHEELARALGAASEMLSRDSETPLDHLYLARLRELSLEAALCASAGTRDVGALARARFSPDPHVARDASSLARAWLEEPAPPPVGEAVRSDAPDARSLLSCMRAAVQKARLSFSVLPHLHLASLAATGERVILVASGRRVHEEDSRRTVIHEVEGHARPRECSRRSSVPLLRAGTAQGIDHQEGYALLLEERHGYLGARRRRQLAARHRAVEAMIDGGTFADVASTLVHAHGVEADEAVLVAERVFRGGDGTSPGLGRERVYIESFVRVQRHLQDHPEDEAVLAAGLIGIDAIDAVRPYVEGPAAPHPGRGL